MATHLKIDMDIKISEYWLDSGIIYIYYSILQLSINKELLYMHELIEKFNKNIQSQNIGHTSINWILHLIIAIYLLWSRSGAEHNLK